MIDDIINCNKNIDALMNLHGYEARYPERREKKLILDSARQAIMMLHRNLFCRGERDFENFALIISTLFLSPVIMPCLAYISPMAVLYLSLDNYITLFAVFELEKSFSPADVY